MFSLIYRNLHGATLDLVLLLRCFSPCCISCIFLVNCEILMYIKLEFHVNSLSYLSNAANMNFTDGLQ